MNKKQLSDIPEALCTPGSTCDAISQPTILLVNRPVHKIIAKSGSFIKNKHEAVALSKREIKGLVKGL